MKAMIFAAGLGTRLGAITREIPKALVHIGERSVLELAVEKVAGNGFDDIIINVHHFAEKVIEEVDRLRGKGFRITVSDERDKLLETGGGLYKARWFFDKEPFLIYNSDIITDLDLEKLYIHHLERRGLATLAVMDRKDNRYFLTDEDGAVSGWRNRETGEEIITGSSPDGLSEAAFCGIQVADPEIFSYMAEGFYSLTTLYLQLASARRIFTLQHKDIYWADIGSRSDLEKVRKQFEKK